MQGWIQHPMNRDMTIEEFAVYALTHKKLKEGMTASFFMKRFPPQHLWVVKRVLMETMSSKPRPIVNWCVVRSALLEHEPKYDPDYEKHVFDQTPERYYFSRPPLSFLNPLKETHLT